MLDDYPAPDADETFSREILTGLSAEQKYISSKWLYDTYGSELFEEITKLDDYYPTRVERTIFERIFPTLDELVGKVPAIAEFGSGASVKTRKLIEALRPSLYVPIDIAEEFLESAVTTLQELYPWLEIEPVVADLTSTYSLPKSFNDKQERLGFFPGSTIGNFRPTEAVGFLQNAKAALGIGAKLLISADLIKDKAVLERAYDDSEGVTAKFNLNLLTRINRDLGADFDLEQFRHVAIYNTDENRIEMHLESLAAQSVTISDSIFNFAAGERIHTENSYKYSVESFTSLASKAGWSVEKQWQDEDALFSVYLLTG
jgi:dimethylhistidine N-methyltransferase